MFSQTSPFIIEMLSIENSLIGTIKGDKETKRENVVRIISIIFHSLQHILLNKMNRLCFFFLGLKAQQLCASCLGP